MTEYYDSSVIAYVSESETEAESSLTMDYKNSTYTVISKVAYLIGVPKTIFENYISCKYILYQLKVAQWFMNLTRIHENVGLIPVHAQLVKDLSLSL